MNIEHLNPPALHTNPAFSQGVLVRGDHDTLYVGGQNGTDASGQIVPGGLAAQSAQAIRNVLAVLEAAGADQTNVVHLTITLLSGESFQDGYSAVIPIWGMHPTAITGTQVSALARPDALVEIEAIAAIPRAQ
ncbi:RidA family protein [Agromyces intestinalis]|uniref:RidA family protein n=1 Tax=Agromyces intestinalis TaxID=2592652 RepID=A0A5C1YD59_9MICO|nr:RidA family protein [Agromyces intestinalis]QEO13976.1 RidA family protein [Agromyces intestinalis]